MPLTTSRMFTVRGWPPSLGAGIRDSTMAHSWSVSSLGYLFSSCSISLPSPHHPSLLSYLLFKHPLTDSCKKTKVTEFPDLLALAAWERLYQARLPIGGRIAASGLGNSTRKVGSNGTSLRLWA